MNKYLKYGLWSIGAVLVLITGVLTYIALTFDPNTYKPQIIQAVKDNKQRTLKLNGDIKLTFFPSVGVNIGQISLSEFKSEQEFASVESARVSLALLPLLSKQVVVDEVAVNGVKVRVIKFKDGKSNLDDLMAKEATPAQPAQAVAPSAPVQFDIASVRINNTELSYRDEASGTQYSVKDLSLKTGRIAHGVPSKIDFAAHILANQPKLDIAAQIKATLTFDLEKNRYEVQGLDLQAKGVVLDIADLLVKAGGNASAQPGTQEFALKNFSLSASGAKGKDRFDVKLDAPALSLTKDKFFGEGVELKATLDAALGKVVAVLSLPGLEGDSEKFKLKELALNVDVKQSEQAFQLKLTTPVTGNLKTQQFNLSDLLFAVNATGDKLPGKSIHSEMKGSVQADLGRHSIQAKLAGGLLQSQIKAKLAVNNFAAPAIRYDLEVDKFDADPYLPQKIAAAKEQDKNKASEPEQPFDLSALKSLNLEGSVCIGALKAANVKVAQLRIDTKARDGVVSIAPISAKLYQGSIDGKISVNAATNYFTVSQKMSGVDIAPLLKDALDLELAEGKGNVTIDVTAQGNMVSALKKSLNGNLSLNLQNGAIKGINLAKLVQGVQSLNKQTTTQTVGIDKSEKTEFQEFKASFVARNGVAHNDDLSVKSTVLRITGNGDIDIGLDSLDYNANAIFAKADDGRTTTLPVNLSGPFDNLKFKVDYGAMVADAAKQELEQRAAAAKAQAKAAAQQQVDAKKSELKSKAEQELKKGLQGLFK